MTFEALKVLNEVVAILEPEIKESRRGFITIRLYTLGKVDGQGWRARMLQLSLIGRRLCVAYPISERLRKSRGARNEFHLCLKYSPGFP